MASIVISDRERRKQRHGINLVVNDNFYYYDGEYSVAVSVPSSTLLETEVDNRDLDVDSTASLSLLRPQLPTLAWQVAQLTHLATLPQTERRAIGDYVNYESDEVNNELLVNPDQTPLLNRIITELPPLEKEIVAWRYIRAYEITGERKNPFYLPPDSGEFEYHSYLSTSFMTSCVVTQHACRNEVLALMRIVIPQGTRCLYVPGNIEYEILFPHKTRLRIDGKEQRSFRCSRDWQGQATRKEFTVTSCQVL
jgi:ADP-ribosyltransferase exoenzyme